MRSLYRPSSIQFQSTHLHEVWLRVANIICGYDSFNPHTYMRCDTKERWRYSGNHVSIHTPTWGVTLLRLLLECIKKFQSTHLHEVWQILDSRMLTDDQFQSTHLHEVWLFAEMLCENVWLFQSTHLHEVWLPNILQQVEKKEFQSTHLHEVWPRLHMKITITKQVSIHTPTWGVTRFEIKVMRNA